MAITAACWRHPAWVKVGTLVLPPMARWAFYCSIAPLIGGQLGLWPAGCQGDCYGAILALCRKLLGVDPACVLEGCSGLTECSSRAEAEPQERDVHEANGRLSGQLTNTEHTESSPRRHQIWRAVGPRTLSQVPLVNNVEISLHRCFYPDRSGEGWGGSEPAMFGCAVKAVPLSCSHVTSGNTQELLSGRRRAHVHALLF